MQKNNNNHLKWFKKADEDETVIKIMLEENGPPNPICFHAQQMAEKYMKGLLTFIEKHFEKVHDLIQLETLLLENLPDIKSIHDDLTLLNRYYIETRYPGDYPEFTLTEARGAFESAQGIKEYVLAKIEGKT